MPSKKKKYNARFPAGRIKKIMQTDEEVGKVAQAVPVIISRTLELFVESLLKKTVEVTTAKNAKTLTPSHLKQCILSESRFDFLTDLVSNIPDAVEEDEISNSNPVTNRRRTSVETAPTHSSKPAPVFNLAGSHNNHVSQQSSSNSAGTSFNLQSVPTSGIPVQTIRYAPAASSTHNHPTSNHLLPAVSHAYSNQYSSGSVVDSQSSHVSSFGNNASRTSQRQASAPLPPSGIPGDAHNHVKITVPANLLSAAPTCVKITVPGNNHVLHSFPIDIPTGSPYSVPELNGTVPRRDSGTNVFNGMVPSYTPAPAYSSSNLVIDEDYDN